MSKVTDNAFPMMPSHTRPDDVDQKYLGLTKREFFAAMAMQGFLANSYSNGMSQPLSETNKEEIASLSVGQADALMGALKHLTPLAEESKDEA